MKFILLSLLSILAMQRITTIARNSRSNSRMFESKINLSFKPDEQLQIAAHPNMNRHFDKQKNLMLIGIDDVILHSTTVSNLQPTLVQTILNNCNCQQYQSFADIDSDTCTKITINVTTYQNASQLPAKFTSDLVSTISLHDIVQQTTQKENCIDNFGEQRTSKKSMQQIDRYIAFSNNAPELLVDNTLYWTTISLEFLHFFHVLKNCNIVLYATGSVEYAQYIYEGLQIGYRFLYPASIFSVDAIICAHHRHSNSLSILESGWYNQALFSPLAKYESVVILDSDSRQWNSYEIRRKQQFDQLPFLLIQVPKFQPVFKGHSISYNGIKPMFFENFQNIMNWFGLRSKDSKLHITREFGSTVAENVMLDFQLAQCQTSVWWCIVNTV